MTDYDNNGRIQAVIELLESMTTEEKSYILGWLNADLISDELEETI